MQLNNLTKNKKLFGTLLILLIVLVWGIRHSKFSFDKYDPTYDMRGQYDVSAVFIRDAVINHHQFPLWIPYVYGGTPFFQYPQHPIFNIANLLVLVLPSFNMAINLLGMIQLFIIGISMYFLVLELKLDYKYALIAAFTFMFNRYNQNSLISGGELHFDSIVWLPAVFLFILRAYKRKEWIKSSVFAGIFLALSFHAGDVSVFTYILFLVALFFVYLFFTGMKKYKKIVLISLVLMVVLFGLSAIRLLPLMDFSKVTDLSGGRSFEGARGQHYVRYENMMDMTSKLIKAFVTSETMSGSNDLQIGLIVLILAIFSLALVKNKYVLFFVISVLLLFNISTGSYLFYLLWRFFPGFSRQHHIIRILHLAPFCFSVLAGFGAKFLFENLVGRIKNKKARNAGFFVFVLVLFITLPYESPKLNFVRINMEEEMNSNPLMVYLHEAGQSGLFRSHRWGLFNHIGGSGQSLWIPMGISTIHGQLNPFAARYLFEFINPVAASNPAKVLGMYNTRYFYSADNISSEDLALVREFERCDRDINPICDENFGPYLYLNKRFIPRAYLVDNAILIIGEEQKTIEAMYSFILNKNFNPSNLAVVLSDSANIPMPLSRFKAVIMLESPKDMQSLKGYVDGGGILLPNIFERQSTITLDDIDKLLLNFNSSYGEVKTLEISEFKPNSMAVKLNKEEGFAVIAEKYFMYDGWHVKPEKRILRANGFSSAVWVGKDDSELRFSYFPGSFKGGLAITLVTLLGILAFFIFSAVKKDKPALPGKSGNPSDKTAPETVHAQIDGSTR